MMMSRRCFLAHTGMLPSLGLLLQVSRDMRFGMTVPHIKKVEEFGMPKKNPFKLMIGIVGSPSSPEIEWSDTQLEQIKALGVNMLQLSIAWGGKPADEVINLEDLDDAQKMKWHYRITQAKKHGFSCLAHFGVPRM